MKKFHGIAFLIQCFESAHGLVFPIPPVANSAPPTPIVSSLTQCVSMDDPDDFDYSCQQAPGIQLLTRGGKSLTVQQAWGDEGQSSTGASIWPSAVSLSRYLEDESVLVKGKNVLEIGSGLGVNSLAAEAIGAKMVTITDGDPSVLNLASGNMQRNFPRATNVRVRALSFGDKDIIGSLVEEAKEAGGYDLIIGSDLTYKKDGWPTFVSTIRDLGSDKTVALYATAPRYRGEWESLQKQFEEAGFMAENVAVKPRSSDGGILTDDIRILKLSHVAVPVADSVGNSPKSG